MNAHPPTLRQVIELRERAPGSLESAAAEINREIDLYRRSEGIGWQHRIRAGTALISVRPQVVEAGYGWEAWCAKNINRSMREIYRLIKMASANDPRAALEEERAKARLGMIRTREKMTNVSQVEHIRHVDPQVEHVFSLFLKLDADQRAEFMTLVEEEMRT